MQAVALQTVSPVAGHSSLFLIKAGSRVGVYDGDREVASFPFGWLQARGYLQVQSLLMRDQKVTVWRNAEGRGLDGFVQGVIRKQVLHEAGIPRVR